MRANEAFIFSQLWLIIATRNSNDNDQKSLAMIPGINFISVSQNTPATSFPFYNFTQNSQEQHDERRSLKARNRRFQHYQQRKEAETLVGKESDDMEESLIKLPVVTFVQTYASNDTRLIPPANSSTLQNIAFPVLPNSENHRNRRRKLSNDTGTSEEDNESGEEDNNGLNNNVIDMELEIQRKMERTTIEVRNYPPVTKASPITATNPEQVSGLPILTTPLSASFTVAQVPSRAFDFGIRTTVSYANLSASLPPSVIEDQSHNREVIQQRPNVTELSVIPPFTAPVALPIPLSKAETPFNLFDTQLENSGISAVISDGHFRKSDSTDVGSTSGKPEQQHQLPAKIPMQMQMRAREYEPVDDVLGCTWDIVTNSCKDLFSLKLCSHCHDFGNIFLHNCKCLLKYTTTF
uniref:Uncharacterized protein n=1 Tax=Elaeophora elaphi TaxID=1147741 RepID=A0A0R3RPS1_9BILA